MLPKELKRAAHWLQHGAMFLEAGTKRGRCCWAGLSPLCGCSEQTRVTRSTRTDSQNPQDVFLSKRGHISQHIWRLFYISSALALLPVLSPARAEALPLIPFHSSISWADVCNVTSAENSCSNQGPLQPSLLQHSSHCHSISELSWAACKWLWIHRAPVLVLNPLSKCLLQPLRAGCCYSGRRAFWEGL